MKTAVPLYSNKLIVPESALNSNVVKTAMDSYGSKKFVVSARIENGAVPPIQGSNISISYGFSNVDYSAVIAKVPEIFAYDAETINLPLIASANATRIWTSNDINVDGLYLYTWLDYTENIGVLNTTLTLNVDAVLTKYSDSVVPKSYTARTNGYKNSLIVKQGPGVLFSLFGYNSKDTAQFIQVHDAVAVPADGAVPMISIVADRINNFGVDVPLIGMDFQNGIVICNSSTCPSKTIALEDCFMTANYI